MYKEVFALRLYAKRKELDISQIQVSNETGINQSNISKFETGKLEPSLETLGILANYYQVSIDWLLGNPHNGKEGNVAIAAINEFYQEILDSIKGSEYQASKKEDFFDILSYSLETDKTKIINKYSNIEGRKDND